MTKVNFLTCPTPRSTIQHRAGRGRLGCGSLVARQCADAGLRVGRAGDHRQPACAQGPDLAGGQGWRFSTFGWPTMAAGWTPATGRRIVCPAGRADPARKRARRLLLRQLGAGRAGAVGVHLRHHPARQLRSRPRRRTPSHPWPWPAPATASLAHRRLAHQPAAWATRPRPNPAARSAGRTATRPGAGVIPAPAAGRRAVRCRRLAAPTVVALPAAGWRWQPPATPSVRPAKGV